MPQPKTVKDYDNKWAVVEYTNSRLLLRKEASRRSSNCGISTNGTRFGMNERVDTKGMDMRVETKI